MLSNLSFVESLDKKGEQNDKNKEAEGQKDMEISQPVETSKELYGSEM